MSKLFNIIIKSTIVLMTFLASYNCKCSTNQEITRLFEESDMIILMKTYKDTYTICIEGNDFNTLKEELIKISEPKQYTSTFNPFTEFKKGYKLMYLHLKQKNKYVPILYSIDDRSMIIRNSDLYNIDNTYPTIDVLEFTITYNAASLIQQYERELPEKGVFYYSWPTP